MADDRDDEPTEPAPQRDDERARTDQGRPESEPVADAEPQPDADESGDADSGADEVHIRRPLTRSERRALDAADAATRALSGGNFSAIEQQLNAMGDFSQFRALEETLASMRPAGLESLARAVNPDGQLRAIIDQSMPTADVSLAAMGIAPRWAESIAALQLAGVGSEPWRAATSITPQLDAFTASFSGSLQRAMGAALESERWWDAVVDTAGIGRGYEALIGDLDPSWLGAATQAFDPSETFRTLLAESTAQDAFARLGASGAVAERFASIISTIDLDPDVDVVVARIEEQAPTAIDGAPMLTRRDMIAIGGYITLLAFSLLVLLHLTHPEVAEELSDLKEYAEIAVGAGVAVYKVLERRSEKPAS